MDCPGFTKWLENRDMYDVSEADKALKHTVECVDCACKLELDEQFDRLLSNAFKSVEMPASLKGKVELSLEKTSEEPSKKKYGIYGIFSTVMAAAIALMIYFPSGSGIPTMDALAKYAVADHTVHDDSILVVHKADEFQQLPGVKVSYEDVQQGLPKNMKFAGARICPLGDCKTVHMVYYDGDKRVSVFLVKTDDVAFSISAGRKYSISMDDHTVNFWKKDGYVYAMVA